jgi:hypothetical protein
MSVARLQAESRNDTLTTAIDVVHAHWISTIGNDPLRKRLARGFGIVRLVHLRSRDDVFGAARTFAGDVHDARLRNGDGWSVDVARA